MRRIIGDAPRIVRRGVSPNDLGVAMEKQLDPSNPLHANIRAALTCGLQGLLRSAELCSKNGVFDAQRTIRRCDINSLTQSQLILMISPCKNMKNLGGRNCPLVIGSGGEFIDAVAEVTNLLKVNPVDSRSLETTPLFWDTYTNRPLTYDLILSTIRSLMASVGQDASHGTNSLRIRGATALFAAGANETVIRTMGPWSSDIHQLYVRACFEQCCDWTRKAGSTKVSDLAGTFDEVADY